MSGVLATVDLGISPGDSGIHLTANPHVELQDGPVKKDYQAREVHGEEYAVWFERAAAAWPDYTEYQKKTTRTMPIFVLTPLDAQQSAP